MFQNTVKYKGNCEIIIYDRESLNQSVEIGSRSISINVNGYEEGSYYCEIEFYPVTEIAKSLNVYSSMGGELVKEKW